MMKKRTVALLLTLVLAVACSAVPAAAEWNIDLYGGAAWVESSNLGARGQDSNGASVNLTIFDLDTTTGFTVGLRTGYWLESLPFLGFDLDVFYLQVPIPAQTTTGTATLNAQFLNRPITVNASGVASIPSATLPAFAFAPEIRLRWPLMVDAEFPQGRWQPYFTGGPAWAFSLNDSSLAVEFGGKGGGGLAFSVTRWLALFREYRYTFFPGFKLTDNNITYKANLNTHTVVGGVSFRF